MKLNKIGFIPGLVILAMLVSNFCCAQTASKKVYNRAEVIYLHSNGETPAPDEETPDGRPVILPILSNLCQAKGVIIPVDNIFGFKATSLAPDTVVLSWRPVVRYTDPNTSIFKLTKYVIYRAIPGASFTVFDEKDSLTYSCTDSASVAGSLYKAVAVDDMDNTSGYSITVDTSGKVYAYRNDIDTSRDTYTKLVVPSDAAGVVYQGGDNDIHLEASRVQEDEGKSCTIGGVKGTISTSISFDAYRYKNREKLASLQFPGKVQITLRYEIDEKGLVKNTTLPAGRVKEKMGLYYFNGIEWIKIPATIDLVNQTLTAEVNHLSKYALITGLSNPTKLTLTKRIPPIITPNGDGINDFCFFYYENPKGKPVTLKIFDLSGSLVRQIEESIPGQIKWDGKDSNGDIAESGAYVYQIQAGEEVITGSVVIAK